MINEPRASAVPGLAGFDTAEPLRRRTILSPAPAPVSHASSIEPLPGRTGLAAALAGAVAMALTLKQREAVARCWIRPR